MGVRHTATRGGLTAPAGGGGSAACCQRLLPRLPRAGMLLPNILALDNARNRGLWGVAAGGVNMCARIAAWPARGLSPQLATAVRRLHWAWRLLRVRSTPHIPGKCVAK